LLQAQKYLVWNSCLLEIDNKFGGNSGISCRLLWMQELDLCLADWRFRIIRFDQSQEMHLAREFRGDDHSPIHADAATEHRTFTRETRDVSAALQIPHL
jgi:hypothetical protein